MNIDLHKRREIMQLLAELSDEALQQRLWLDHENFPNASGIDEVFHLFFDDTDLSADPESEVGRTLLNEVEVNAIKSVTQALSSMLARLGDVNSRQFMADSDWPHIVSLAGSALRSMKDSNGDT